MPSVFQNYSWINSGAKLNSVTAWIMKIICKGMQTQSRRNILLEWSNWNFLLIWNGISPKCSQVARTMHGRTGKCLSRTVSTVVTKGPNTVEVIDWVDKKRKDYPRAFLVTLWFSLQLIWTCWLWTRSRKWWVRWL